MSTNLKRWLQAVLAFVLCGTAIWQSSVASAMVGMPIEWPHLILALLLIVPVALLISHEVIGEGVIDRLMILTFLVGFVWYSLQSINSFVLHLHAEKSDLIRAGMCGVLLVLCLAVEEMKKRRSEDG